MTKMSNNNNQTSSLSPCPDPMALAAYVDGTLSAAERMAIHTHLASCGSCRLMVEQTRLFLVQDLSLDTIKTSGIKQKIRADLVRMQADESKVQAPSSVRRFPIKPRRLLPLAAAACFFLSLGFLFSGWYHDAHRQSGTLVAHEEAGAAAVPADAEADERFASLHASTSSEINSFLAAGSKGNPASILMIQSQKLSRMFETEKFALALIESRRLQAILIQSSVASRWDNPSQYQFFLNGHLPICEAYGHFAARDYAAALECLDTAHHYFTSHSKQLIDGELCVCLGTHEYAVHLSEDKYNTILSHLEQLRSHCRFR